MSESAPNLFVVVSLLLLSLLLLSLCVLHRGVVDSWKMTFLPALRNVAGRQFPSGFSPDLTRPKSGSDLQELLRTQARPLPS